MPDFPRLIKQVVEPQNVIEGAGVRLRRAFGPSRANPLDPFLLYDHFHFDNALEGPITGFPTHPHRGIETVSYILEGSVRHRDSLGHTGIIGAGDVQWMTSGRGILHEEMPKRGPDGVITGFQLWVNLPAAKKMVPPRYQEVNAQSIPTVQNEGIKVRVIAGTYEGVQGPVTEIAANPLYLDVQLKPGVEIVLPTPLGHTVMAYLFKGGGWFGVADGLRGSQVTAVHMVIFDDGDHMRVRAADDTVARFIVIAGAPFKEPIFPYGPFVMNSPEEIMQAFEDLRNGTFVKDSPI